jgi:hypothetical protein
MSFLDPITGGGPATHLATNDPAAPVKVSDSAPPSAGDVLTALDGENAIWQPPSGGGGSGTADALATSGNAVSVVEATPPNPGDVLTAVDAEHATWQAPSGGGGSGLRYVDLETEQLDVNTWGVTHVTTDEGYYLATLAGDVVPGTRVGFQIGTDSSHAGFEIDGYQIQALDGTFGNGASLNKGQYAEWTLADDGLFYLTSASPGMAETYWPEDLYSDASGSSQPGQSMVPSRNDHKHVVKTAAPAALTVGGAMSAGDSVYLPRANHVHAMPGIATAAAPGFLSAADKSKLDGVEAGAQVTSFTRVQTALAGATGPVSFGGQTLSNVASPIIGTDVTTKSYVDSVAQGLTTKSPARVLARTNITLSGLQTIDGVTLLAGDRVLVTGQTTASANGIYTAASGAWVRATDADVSAEVVSGMYTFIAEGTLYANTGWVLQTANPITLGTTPLTFVQFSGAGQATAGTGLVKTGSTFDVVAHADGSIVANADSIQVGVLATDAQHGVRGGGTLHANASGTVAGFMSAADKSRLDAVVATVAPAAIVANATAAAGTNANVAARVDHVHSVTTASPVALTLAAANTLGSGTGLSYSNHIHALPASNVAPPTALAVGGTAVAGTNAAISNAGHTHTMPGIATTLSDGFMNSIDKSILDGLFSAPDPGVNDFRLSPTNDDSIPADGSYGSLFFVGVTGDCIGLYDAFALGWRQCRVANFNKAVAGRIAGRPFDVFLYLTFPSPLDGTAALVDFEYVDWTSASQRATGLVRVNGVWTKSGDQTRRYIGTVAAASATSFLWQLNGSGSLQANLPIWNVSNRRRITLRYLPTFDTYLPPDSLVYRWGNNAGAQIGIVTGNALEPIDVEAIATITSYSAHMMVGIGVDTLVFQGGRSLCQVGDTAAMFSVQARHAAYALGYHQYIALVFASYVTGVLYGSHVVSNVSIQSAFYATLNQ